MLQGRAGDAGLGWDGEEPGSGWENAGAAGLRAAGCGAGPTGADPAARRTCPAPSSTSWSSPRRGRRDAGPARDCGCCPVCTNGAERRNFRYGLGERRG